MFAYCLNNPINLFDYTGELPQAIVDKIVHNEVLRHICMLYADLSMSKTCIYYNGVNARAGWGFCDLYNTKTGEVWELKKNSTSLSCQTCTATEQLNRYVNGSLKHSPELDLKKPYITNIRSGNFTFTSNGYIYDVSFWNEGNGILRYDYTREKTDKRKNAELAIGVIAVVVVSGFPAVIPIVVAGGAGCIIVG